MIENHNSLAEKFLKKGFRLYLFSFIIGPIGYVIRIIISNDLRVEEVGILYGIISLITMLSSYNDLGMTESLKHFVPEFVNKKEYNKVKSTLFYALFLQIITSLLIAWFFFWGADFIATHYFKTMEAKTTLKTFAFFFIGLNIFQTLNNFLLAIQDTFSYKRTELFRMGFIMLFVLFIFFAGKSSLENYSYAWLFWLYVGIITIFITFTRKYYIPYLQKEKLLFDTKLIKRIFKYALLVLVWSTAGTILGQIDMQMIIYILGTKEAWYYTNYLSIIWIPFIIIGPIFSLLFPVFSDMYTKWENEKIKLVKSIFQKNFLAIWIALNILFFVFAEVIAYILFWEKFIPSGTILKYSILFLIFNFLLQMNFNILSWIGKVKERVKIILIAIIFNFTTNIIFIHFLWASWAALATGLGWILIWILSEIRLGKKYFVWFNIPFLIKNIFCFSTLGIFSYFFILNLFVWLWRVKSLFLLAVISIIYFSFFIIINQKETKIFINEVKKLRKK